MSLATIPPDAVYNYNYNSKTYSLYWSTEKYIGMRYCDTSATVQATAYGLYGTSYSRYLYYMYMYVRIVYTHVAFTDFVVGENIIGE